MANVDCRISRALQTYTITYPAPDETLLGTPVALPTTEPADPQISYTIAAGHLPTVSPAGLEYTLTAILYAAGKNTNAANQTLYYRVMQNGASVATGSITSLANYYYTLEHSRVYPVALGDVLACKLWATSADVNWDYKALFVFFTRPGPSNVLVQDLSVTLAAKPTLSLGNPQVASTNGWVLCHADLREALGWSVGTQGCKFVLSGSTYRLGRTNRGDITLTTMGPQSATYRPRYEQHALPTALSFRPLTIRV